MSANFFKLKKGLNLDPQTAYGAGDPPGDDGDIYYNTTLAKFRKYEGGAWTNMDTTGGGGGSSWVANSAVIASGATSKVISFSSAQPDTSYIVFAQLENIIDASPLFQQVEVVVKDVNGFIASWNMPTDSANYRLSYLIPTKTFVIGEAPISNTSSNVAVVPSIPTSSLNAGILVAMQNTTDPSPQFQTPMLSSSLNSYNRDVGTIIASSSTSVPVGTMYCNGQSLLRTAYPELFAKIGTANGAIDSFHFSLPDYRGKFLRGQNDSTGADPDAATRTVGGGVGGNAGDNIGSMQGHQYYSHVHGVNDSGHTHNLMGNSGGTINNLTGATQIAGLSGSTATGYVFGPPYTQNTATGVTLSASGGNETRPINVNVRYYIAYISTTNSGFTASWNAPTDSSNYVLTNMIKATGAINLNSGITSTAVTLPVGYGSSNYAVIAMMQNLNDSSPLFQPIIITAKTSNTFTAKWNLPTDSNNYMLSYYAISFAT
jgi:microcystin-dependent protein